MSWRSGYNLQKRLRPVPQRSLRKEKRSREDRLISPLQMGLLGIISALIIVSYVVPVFGTGFRWALYVYLIIVVAWAVTAIVYRRSVPTPPLEVGQKRQVRYSGEFEDLVSTIERADRGKKYSQRKLMLRARHAFLAKLAYQRGLTQEGLDSLLRSPSELRRAVRDPVILRFLEDTSAWGRMPTTSSASDVGPGFQVARGEPPSRALSRVLKAMEAWH